MSRLSQAAAGPDPVFEATLTEEIEHFVSPGARIMLSGEFVPLRPEATLEVVGCAEVLEGSAGHAVIEAYVGDPSLVPLTPDSEGDPDPGVQQVTVGAVSARAAPFGRRVELAGLTPGQPLAYEVAALIVGGAFRLTGLPIPGGYWACSTDARYGIQEAGRKPGEFIVATRGANRVIVIRSNHYAHPAENTLLGSVTLASAVAATRIAITPDGTKSFSPIFETDRLAVVTNLATPAPTHVETALPVGRTDPADIAITPDGSTVWVICFASGHAVKFNVGAGTFDDTKTVNLGAASSALYATINPAGTRLYVVMNATRTIKVIDLTQDPPTVIATIGPIGASGAIQNLAITPDGTTGYAVVGTGIYTINLTTNAVSGPVASGAGAPALAKVMSDGRTLMIADTVSGAGTTQFHQFNLPSLSKYHSWPNALDGQVREGINDMAITPNGSFMGMHTPNTVNIWPGARVSIRPTMEQFNGEFLALRASPALPAS